MRLAGLYAFARDKEIGVVSRATEIVIEGFPRSANTYAYAAFVYAQRRNVRVAHHIHGAAQVSLAAKLNIPTILLIREPKSAVASLVVRDKSVNVGAALRQYLGFYRPVIALRGAVVVAPFENVIHHFGETIEEVNARFGTRFSVYERTTENEAAVAKIIDEMDRKDSGTPDGSALRVARPTVEKESQKANIESEFGSRRVATLLREAESLYERLMTWR